MTTELGNQNNGTLDAETPPAQEAVVPPNRGEEITALLALVVEARAKEAEKEAELETKRKTYEEVTDDNNEHMRQLDKENRDLREKLEENSAAIRKEISTIESSVAGPKARMVRDIELCSLRLALPSLKISDSAPENTLLQSRFFWVYECFGTNKKPTNKHTWTVHVSSRVDTSADPENHTKWRIHEMSGVEEAAHDAQWDRCYFSRDFKSPEEAVAYAKKNGPRVIEPLVNKIKGFEAEVDAAAADMDAVFDFRLKTEESFIADRNEVYEIIQMEKDKLVVAPETRSYNKEDACTITVVREGVRFTVSGHRRSSQADELLEAIKKYFGLLDMEEAEE